ncbi:unnamed protein product [Klebsiella pneumoniae]|nr:unnamed protein product [Klebsiella pneumoniae]
MQQSCRRFFFEPRIFIQPNCCKQHERQDYFRQELCSSIMKIELINKKVESLVMTPLEGASSGKKTMKATVTLNNELYSNVKDAKLFRVRYFAYVTIEERLKMEITYDFDFRSEEDFSDDTAKSPEVRSLVPSIAYPYIKGYAEQIIHMSNLGSFNLPYFDFFTSPMEPNNSK